MKTRWILCVAATLMALIINQAPASVTYQDGASHSVNNFSGIVYVYNSPAGEPTTIIKNQVGTVGGICAYDDSQVFVSRGWVKVIDAHDNAEVTIAGLQLMFFNSLSARDNSTLLISDGGIAEEFSAYSNVFAYGSSTIMISGGIRDSTTAYDDSYVAVSGGTISGSLSASGTSNVTISDGSIGGQLYASADSNLAISGGSIGGDLETSDSSRITISGGAIGGQLFIYGTVIIEGGDFVIGGQSVPGGTTLDSGGWAQVSDTLTSTLANGDLMTNNFTIYEGGSLVLIPEPATMGLLALGGVALLRRRTCPALVHLAAGPGFAERSVVSSSAPAATGADRPHVERPQPHRPSGVTRASGERWLPRRANEQPVAAPLSPVGGASCCAVQHGPRQILAPPNPRGTMQCGVGRSTTGLRFNN